MKPIIIVTIVAFALTIAGAQSINRQSYYPAIEKNTLPRVAINKLLGTHNPKMWTCNTVLYLNETIVLRFEPPNPPFLGIIDPQGHFFYLVFPAEDVIGNLMPFIESKCFESLRELQINTTTLHGDPYTYGVYDTQLVFTQSGVYTFIMGGNLHVDSFYLLENVKIKYIHSLCLNQPIETIVVK